MKGETLVCVRATSVHFFLKHFRCEHLRSKHLAPVESVCMLVNACARPKAGLNFFENISGAVVLAKVKKVVGISVRGMKIFSLLVCEKAPAQPGESLENKSLALSGVSRDSGSAFIISLVCAHRKKLPYLR